MRKVAGFLAVAMVLTMLTIPAFATGEVITDPEQVAMANNVIVFEEDFTDNSKGWTLTGGAKIEGGKLYLSDTTSEEQGTAKYDFSYSTTGNWYVTFKLMTTDNASGNKKLVVG